MTKKPREVFGEGGARSQEEAEKYRLQWGSYLPKIRGYEKETVDLLMGD